ncbi:restriction endonuclease subunit S [Campylobacter upsaliensis]|uniref:restriction endonuclease subunit S n=1 Tax=Campylobacter upsaliensis TaxID=28080 RepID=UPI002B391522|nr:restriction endonuclease subunit S [Campylobacter upsaliensis]MEB2822599.1 restriction endonuclease subunit S [Campylobacter upsaliensis]
MKALNNNAHPLESLLKQHCPNGVEFKELGEVCETLPKGTLKTSQLTANGYPVINSGRDLYGYYSKFNNESNAFTIAARGEYAGFVNFMDSKFWAGGLCYPYRSNDENKLLTKFIYYHLKTNESNIMDSLVARGSIPAINKKDIDKKLKIPIPPLEIQQKIVDILDAFTELQAELQAELHARRKQYEYYRNKLLSFEELQRRTDMLNGGGLKLVSLGEIGTFTRGNGLTKSDFVEVGVPCIHYGQIHTHYHNYTHSTTSFVSEEKARKLKKAKCGDLVIAGVSEDKDCVCKAVVYLGKQEACVSGDTFIFSHSQNPKFIGYMFQTENFNTFKHKYAQGAKVLRVHNKHLENFQIPLPPLEVQNEIVEILDKFDTLANDLSAGLPAEIEARKKQYEYYRERLLSFIAKD